MSQHLNPQQRVQLAAGAFTLLGWILQIWRLHSLAATMDQGILFQVFRNGLSSHPFVSSISSQLSTNVVHSGEGQPWATTALALWIPLVAVLGKWALPMLHRIAQRRLSPELAAMLTLAFYGANAVIGPALGNFIDLSQLPLCVFVLLLELMERRLWLTLPAALLLPLMREDTVVNLSGLPLLGLLLTQGSK